jgi:hypothetical protein
MKTPQAALILLSLLYFAQAAQADSTELHKTTAECSKYMQDSDPLHKCHILRAVGIGLIGTAGLSAGLIGYGVVSGNRSELFWDLMLIPLFSIPVCTIGSIVVLRESRKMKQCIEIQGGLHAMKLTINF